MESEVNIPTRFEDTLSLSDDLLKAYFFEALDPWRSVVMNVYIKQKKYLTIVIWALVSRGVVS